MNLKPTIALVALSLAVAGCGNKGPLIQAAPPPVQSFPGDAEPAAPAETVPVETPATDTPPADAVPEEASPAMEVPATDAQDG